LRDPGEGIGQPREIIARDLGFLAAIVVHVNTAVESGTGVARFFADGPRPIVVAIFIPAVLSSGPILIVVFIARHEHDLLQRKVCRIRPLVNRAGMTLATFTSKPGGWLRLGATSKEKGRLVESQPSPASAKNSAAGQSEVSARALILYNQEVRPLWQTVSNSESLTGTELPSTLEGLSSPLFPAWKLQNPDPMAQRS
jgi:hypothetical protein